MATYDAHDPAQPFPKFSSTVGNRSTTARDFTKDLGEVTHIKFTQSVAWPERPRLRGREEFKQPHLV